MGRQIRLAWGGQTLNLNDSTYVLQAANGWATQADAVAVRVLVRAGTLAELERRIEAVRRVLALAELYESAQAGDAVTVQTKTCDVLAVSAEIGATWRVRRVTGGRVDVQPLSGTAAEPNAYLLVTLRTTGDWQRIAPAPVLRALTGSASLTATADGGVQTKGAVELWARRGGWSGSTGLTARFFWTYNSIGLSNQINFIRLSGSFRAFFGSGTIYVWDESASGASSGALGLVNGTTYEIVVRWTASTIAVFVGGVKKGEVSKGVVWPAAADMYRVLATDSSTGTQQFPSIQVWPTGLTDAEIAALALAGRPAPELAWCVPPASGAARSALYPIFNTGGDLAGPLRLLLDGSTQDFAQVRAGLRLLRVPTATTIECESGTLGADTAVNSNGTASGGSQARVTPSATSWGTRCTVTLAATPSAFAAMQGEYTLLLCALDSAAAVQTNRVRWRLTIGGQAEAWSDERACAVVNTRSLVELGVLTLPPGNWPAETVGAATAVYTGAFVTLEVQTVNSIGAGGGVLDLDALILLPTDAIGTARATFDVSDADLLLDWTSTPPAALLAREARSLEFGGWATWSGDDLLLPPAAGQTAGALALVWLRDSNEQFWPNDVCDVWLSHAPRWT